MQEAYTTGVCLAIAAGIAFNLGLVVQKAAVNRLGKETTLMRQLIRKPMWLAGFAIQFVLGMPLNMLAQAYIGPAIIPGLTAIGLVVLMLGSVWFTHESITLPQVAGILLVMSAVALFGLSRLAVDFSRIDFYSLGFILRLSLYTMVVAAFSLTCHLVQKKNSRLRGIVRTLDAGFLFALSNLWTGMLMGFLVRWGAGRFSIQDLLPMAVGSCIVFSGNMLAIAETQRAFQVGDAAKLVPLQYLPQQILPLVGYFAVFGLAPPNRGSVSMAAIAVALILFGSILLARGQTLLVSDQKASLPSTD